MCLCGDGKVKDMIIAEEKSDAILKWIEVSHATLKWTHAPNATFSARLSLTHPFSPAPQLSHNHNRTTSTAP